MQNKRYNFIVREISVLKITLGYLVRRFLLFSNMQVNLQHIVNSKFDRFKNQPFSLE